MGTSGATLHSVSEMGSGSSLKARCSILSSSMIPSAHRVDKCRAGENTEKKRKCQPSWAIPGESQLDMNNGQEDISNFQGDVDLRMKSHPSGAKMGPKATHWQSSIIGWVQGY